MRPTLALVLTAALVVVARPARACGGFFCGGTPIVQAGENIAFAVDPGHVKAVVQINYQGEARKFAWVVPVHAEPTLSIGSPTLFTMLAQQTQPQFQLTFENSCQSFALGAGLPAPRNTADDIGDAGSGVTVLSRADVGPYDAAILTATDATALSQWLSDNQYDLTPAGSAALVPYVGSGYYFVALKLQQDKSVGDLRPIALDFAGDTPCIPIRLTSIAAQPGLPIIAYVFAHTRAVPTNYRHVVLNEARIDWLNFGSNYAAVASEAVREAGGHAFLTEVAGSVSSILGPASLYHGGLDTQALAQLSDPVDFVVALEAQNFPQDGLLDLLEKYVPEPQSLVDQGIAEQQFYNQIGSFRSDIANDSNRAPFDAQAFADDLQTTIVQPLVDDQAMLDSHPYMTRLFTTMSPADMTLDPEFDFNSGLGDVSRFHTATARCNIVNSNVVDITLADGESFQVTRGQGPITAGPAAQRIEQLAATGPAKVIQDNTKAIDAALSGCNCGSVDGTAALLLIGLVGAFRRRRAS